MASPAESVSEAGVEWPTIDGFRRWVGRSFLRFFGWKTEGTPPSYSRVVFIAAPHTSNWDLPFMLGVAWSMGLKPTWFGKHTVFKFPLGGFFRWLGGVPVDRRARHDRVAHAVGQLKSAEKLYLVVSPPGTRKKTEAWKSGFYQIARQADVPICCSFLDFGRKVGGIGPAFRPTDDIRADMDKVRAFYDSIDPKFPELKSTIRLALEDGAKSPTAKSPTE